MSESRQVRKAAIRHYFAMVARVVESARLLDAVGIGSGEAIDQAIDALPLDRVSAHITSLQQAQGDLGQTLRDIEAYQSAGKPYGDTYGDLMRWAEEQADENRETEQAEEREADKATDEAEDRAADEGMYDRTEEQNLRAEEAEIDVDAVDSGDD
jgi:hypothetical protein